MKTFSIAVSLLLLGPIAKADVPNKAVIAHRGASDFAPEGTKAAYRIACEIGADYLEIDLQRSSNGALLAFHDDTLDRTTDVAKHFPGRVKNKIDTFTYDELQKLDAGSWFNKANPQKARESYKGQHILTLDEVIDIAEKCEHKIGLYIETKNPDRYPGIERALAKKLKERGWYDPSGRVILQTFDKPSLELLNKEFRGFPIVLLLWLGKGYMESEANYAPDLDDAIRNGASGVGPDFATLLKPEQVKLIEERKLFVHPYNVKPTDFDLKDFAESDKKLEKIGKTGYFTNKPDLLLQHWKRPHLTGEQAAKKLGY